VQSNAAFIEKQVLATSFFIEIFVREHIERKISIIFQVIH